MATQAQDERLEALELKIMDLENTIHQLHEVVLKQYRDLDDLQQQVKVLDQKMPSNEADAPAPGLMDEIPPHY